MPGTGAKMVRRVRLLRKTSPMGKGSSMFRLTPTTDTVPPVAAQERASRTVASAPTASMTDSAPRPSGGLEDLWPIPGATRASMGSAPIRSARARRSGTMSMARIRAGPKSWAHCSAMMPTGPRPTTTTVDPGRMSARTAPDVAGGQDVGQEDRFLVGHPFGNGQGERVGEGHGHGLGLTPGEIGNGAERGRLAGPADVGLPGQARPADAAADDARDQHAVADPDACARRGPLRPRCRWPRGPTGCRLRSGASW